MERLQPNRKVFIPQEDSSVMNLELRFLLLISALSLFAGGLFGPIYAVFVEEIGGDMLTAGIAYSFYAIAAGVLIYLISNWEDHVKHKEKLLVIGYSVGAVGFLGYFFVSNAIDLFLVQIVFGIAEAIRIPAYDGLYSKNLDKGKYTSEWGAWEAMAYIIIGISAIVGGYLATVYGFKILFVLMFVMSLLAALVSAKLFLNTSEKKSKRKK